MIVEAMLWKYGARCAVQGGGIVQWEHPTEPKPSPDQIVIDVNDYMAVRNDLLADEKAAIMDEILRAVAMVFLDQVNELRADHGRQAITRQQLRAAVKAKLLS